MLTETLNTTVLVLLIEDNPASIEPIREALAHRAGWSRLQCVGSVATGIARIAGGGVSVVLLDLSMSRGDGDDGLSHFHRLHAGAPGVPIVVLCRVEEESLALRAVRAGAADYMISERCATDLERLVQSVLERNRRALDSTPVETASARKTGTLITLLGAKGGVGTTTLALNVGCVLARRHTAIVAEIRSTLGTLAQFLGPQIRTRSITALLNMKPAEMAETQVASSISPCRTIPGLNVLFGPQNVEPCPELGPAHAKAILALLAELADFIVVDLPPVLSETNRALIQASNLLALVIERDPICVHAAKMMLQAIEFWDGAPQMGGILVSRAPLNTSDTIAEIEIQLGIPIFGVIPPAQDVCRAAQDARTPLVAFASESLVTDSITALAEKLANPRQIP